MIKKHNLLSIFPCVTLISSCVHFLTSQSFVIDENPIEPFHIRLLCVLLIGSSIIIYVKFLYSFFIKNKPLLSIEATKRFSYLALILSFFTFPLFSNDIFSLWGYCESFLSGHNIYTSFQAESQTQYASIINPLYQNLNCKYGPLSIMTNSIPLLFSKNLWIHYWGTKCIYLIFGIAYIETCLRIISKSKSRLSYLLLLNPIWYIQSIGQLHNDIFGLVFIALGFLFLIKEKKLFASVCFSIAVLFKLTFIVFLALPFLWTIHKEEKLFSIDAMKIAISTLSSLLIIGFISYYPFINDFSELLAPMKAMNTERPSSTLSDILAYAMLIFNDNFVNNYTITIKVCKIIGIASIGLYSLLFLKNYKKQNSYLIYLLNISVFLFFIYSHRFLPWYLMAFPLLLVSERKDWTKWFLLIMTFSFFQDIAVMMDTNTITGQILMATSTILTVLMVFYKLKSRMKF